MLLKDILNKIHIEEIIGNKELDIDNIVYDSRKVVPDSMFICITGFKTDGHIYIDQAIQKGATAIMIEKDLDTYVDGITYIKVKNTRKTMAVIAKNFYQNPSKELDLIGITGTNGKTSTTYMIKSILEVSNKKTNLIGTIANYIAGEEIEADRTTPESIDLQRMFRKMVDFKVDACVMEVSSHSLELQRVMGSEFKIGVFTNLTPEHLDFHESIDKYLNAKKKLFYQTSLCNIINIDDKGGRKILEEISKLSTPILTYGLKKYADIFAQNIEMSMKHISFDLITPKYTEKIIVNIPGKFTVYNALAAIAVSYGLGIDIKYIKEGLSNIKGVAGRMESIDEFSNFAVIVDYAHTPDALENLIKSAREFTQNRLITVFGCGGDRDPKKREIMGKISGEYSDLTIITSDNPRSEDPMKIIKMIEKGIKSTNANYFIEENRREAIALALRNAQKGDVVLIAGKGHETYQIVGDEIFEFDDKKVALEIARKEELI
ncbi:MAG: UDP-N-acetylmuramoyl-L-alanyl-D-glutamate--2,6-diaminopimelate ligase [Clostridiales bacterium]|nr:UDP-N-acetylmuramoyl-L-alanyl-D-glutamate--2,6-diaminopimelate ligase [Clostridiales bacterium]